MMLMLFVFIMVLLFIIPFAPGFRELVVEEDVSPLFINMDYKKEPRYFGISFRKILLEALGPSGAKCGLREIKLSRAEMVEVSELLSIGEGCIVRNICFVQGDFNTSRKVLLEKEVYSQGSATIGESSQLRALAVDGDLHIKSETTVLRWLDAIGDICIESNSSLGTSVSCEGKLTVFEECSFQRLFGCPVVIGTRNTATALPELGAESAIIFPSDAERDISHVSAHSRVTASIITAKSLSLGEQALVQGDIKTHCNLTTEQGVTITGNVFAEGDISLGLHTRVLGNVFSQGHITLHEGVTVGCNGKVKSVISKKGTLLHSGVKIYGFILTEGEGRTV